METMKQIFLALVALAVAGCGGSGTPVTSNVPAEFVPPVENVGGSNEPPPAPGNFYTNLPGTFFMVREYDGFLPDTNPSPNQVTATIYPPDAQNRTKIVYVEGEFVIVTGHVTNSGLFFGDVKTWDFGGGPTVRWANGTFKQIAPTVYDITYYIQGGPTGTRFRLFRIE